MYAFLYTLLGYINHARAQNNASINLYYLGCLSCFLKGHKTILGAFLFFLTIVSFLILLIIY